MSSLHSLTVEQALAELGVRSAQGLRDAELADRRSRAGPNVLPRAGRRSLVRSLVGQLDNLIVGLLAAAAAIAWATGERAEALAVLAVLVLNAAIGFAMERQAGRALESLRERTRFRVSVRRNGGVRQIAADELLPGDIVLLAAGDRVPADLRIIRAAGLRADESSLTGESESVAKAAEPVPSATAMAERASMLFLGTVVVAGRAEAVVCDTGERTELGRIGSLVRDVPQERTPLQAKLDALGKRLAIGVLAIGAVVSAAGWLRGDDAWQMLEVGITLAVAAIPEALPAVTTFILAFGVLRMARRKAIVRRLAAVETLGSTTVICSDKTGTLTLNRMTVSTWRPVAPDQQRLLLEVATLCNDATAQTGDPSEIALVVSAAEGGVDVEALRSRHARVSERPFDSTRKRMLTVHGTPEGDFLWALKGAAGVVLDACDVETAKRPALDAVNSALAREGLRVLAFACKRSPSAGGDSEHGFAFLGFVGMSDPPRPGAAQAVAAARRAGIRLIMLTGDQLETARFVARALGLVSGEPVVRHASELAGADARRLAAETDVFARVTPEDKYRIVEALQSSGEIVAVTGDGVNDAPALRKADVGVAMGQRGTDVAKEAADIVLADDDFATIVAAIEGGRSIYANIEKFVQLMFTHNASEVLVIFAAILLGWPLPLLPLQILWLNLVTDIFPAFGLALEPPERGAMDRAPRPPNENLLSRDFLVRVAWQAGLLAAITLAIYWVALQRHGAGDVARTIALLSMVGVQLGQTFNCRSRTDSVFRGLSRSPYLFAATAAVVALQLFALAFAPLRDLLGLAVPPSSAWGLLALTVPLPIAIVEAQKWLARRSLPPLRAPVAS